MPIGSNTVYDILNSSLWSQKPLSENSLRDIARSVGKDEDDFVRQYNDKFNELSMGGYGVVFSFTEFTDHWLK